VPRPPTQVGMALGLIALSAPLCTMTGMPRISEFYGIVIEMYFGDHPPPHFHALYSGDEALIEIETGDVYAGSLPARALRLVREWLDLHRAEMRANWELASELQPTAPVEPLP